VRYLLGAAHYRSTLDYRRRRSLEAEAAVDRIRSFLAASTPARGHALRGVGSPSIPDAFAAAMDDDLGVPQALAVLHDTVRAGNQALDARSCTTPRAARPGRRDGRGARHRPARPALGARRGAAASALGRLVTRLIEDRRPPVRPRTSRGGPDPRELTPRASHRRQPDRNALELGS
jgi:cysteinyl-tRNA synthetase